MKKWLVAGLMLLSVAPALAQETRGTISGTVRDAQGVIPGALVKVTNVGTNATQEIVVTLELAHRRSTMDRSVEKV